MKEYFIDILKNHYCDFNGRARRKEYWMFTLWYVILNFAWNIIGSILTSVTQSSGVAIVVLIITWLIALAMFLPTLGLSVRRLHDINKSGVYLLLALIPLVGAIILLVWACTEGTIGPNEYGPDPKAAERGGVAA
ncbi:MAG: DUF805 domain-containing protein [Bacteroidales bacterium]|nr:DUF805 domain-containing protein [Bacteroidales bacterium]